MVVNVPTLYIQCVPYSLLSKTSLSKHNIILYGVNLIARAQ